jgi:hypothetical protein
MDIKRKTCDIWNWKKTLFSRHNLCHHWYTSHCFASVFYPQHRSLLTVLSATSAPLYQPLRHQRNVCHPVVNRFTWQTLPTVNRKHFSMNILCIESCCPQKNAQQNSALRYYTPQAWSPFWLLNQPLRHSCVFLLPRLSRRWTVLLHSHTHRKPITSITAIYFHLWPIYWLCVV